SYILLFTSGAENVLRYCVVEHAFTGFQAHFSRAVVSDSVFAGNHEGIRFGRTELRIEHNDIERNRYGIRYHRLEGPVSMEYNRIRNNDVGIFFVPSGQNRVDFMPDEYEADPAYAMMPVIRFNEISGNREYDYRFGDRQHYDVEARDNWWGTTALDKIYSRIYDKKADADLGATLLTPVLPGPPKGIGVRQ
ncbi:right-handed parallel beta-helix repeat-containing protein, partial [bacterium]|nr:right-handed parallel beta-helix repeat-containing protein [bacterium]